MPSIHDKLNRVRKPRVHITYDVETGDAVQQKELPFNVGVMGDFTGDPRKELPSLKDRPFVTIDRDNFNDVMANMAPGLKLEVKNTLADDDSTMKVDLAFDSLEDFEPAAVVEQVAPLKNLMETRNKLRDLMSKIDCSEELEGILEQVLQNSDDLGKLAESLSVEKE